MWFCMEPSRTSSPSAETKITQPLLRFGLAALATWRVTHLLVNEDGPADAIVRVREKLGDSQLGALMDCFKCASMWVALPLAFFAARKPAGRAVAWLALSGAACLIEDITSNDNTPQESISSAPPSQTSFAREGGINTGGQLKGDSNELLRKEASGT